MQGMPLTYRIDPDAGMLLVVGEGTITQSERLQTIRRWLCDPAFRPGLNTLCDFSAVTSAPTMADLREILALVDQHAEKVGKKKLALITTQPVPFGVARQFQTLADSGPLEVSVFKDRRSAWSWLHHDAQEPSRTP
jgi:hypothetical protein